jgi:hypothetical protein
MTETLTVPSREVVFDPHAPCGFDNFPPIVEQYRFFQHALLEAEGQEDETRHRYGPLIGGFKAILNDVQSQLTALDQTLTPEHLMPISYQSPEVRRELAGRPRELQHELRNIQALRFSETDKLVDETLIEYLSKQEIPRGIFDTPPYCKQGDSWDDFRSSMTCANACFRMVFGGITGWVPSEEVVAESFIARNGSSIVDDSEYQKLFKTETFGEISDKKVNILDITGADFTVIGQVSSHMKQRLPEAKVYAVASLASATASRDIWHANVILKTTDTAVICHDPSVVNGRPYKRIPRDVFARRWAGSFNRVQLFVAT